jgi:hypothetical protein
MSEHHVHHFSFFAATSGLLALSRRLAECGLTWETAAALIAACGTFMLGAVSVSREVRAWTGK